MHRADDKRMGLAHSWGVASGFASLWIRPEWYNLGIYDTSD